MQITTKKARKSYWTKADYYQFWTFLGLTVSGLAYPTIILSPSRAFAQTLGTGAAQKGQCQNGLWFVRTLNDFVATALVGLGGADDGLCQIINVVVVLMLLGVIIGILWGIGDNQFGQTPIMDAFKPLFKFILALIVISIVLLIAFANNTVGNGGAGAAGVAQ